MAPRTMSAHVFAFYRFLFLYDPNTGILTRKKAADARGGFRDCDSIIASTNSKGYLLAGIHGKNRRVHRLVWEMHYSEDSPDVIDHVNRDRQDNRISNLRSSTVSGNCQNKTLPLRIECPYRGVHFDGEQKKYRATIHVNGRRKNLGRYRCAEVAAHAYNKAAIQYHGEFASLNVIGGIYDE